MAVHSLCHDKFQLDDPHVVDPRADSPWTEIERGHLADVIATAFAEPIDFPPIRQAVLEEDLIAIAVEPETPCGLEIARLVADRFVAEGHDRQRISILCGEADANAAGQDCIVHDPADSEGMAYLLADESGVPLYVNRVLFDADIVVPIGTGDGGRMSSRLCPAFCDTDTRKHLQRLPRSKARLLARSVADQLGVFWQIRIVTAPGERVLQIMVGSSDSVLQQSGQLGNEVWNLKVDEPAGMVLATIESGCCQSWQNLRRAILNADQVAAEDAVIVVCTELSGRPPSSWPDADRPDRQQDAALLDVFQRRHVYLASRLTRDSTEKLGFGHVESSGQIQKLIDLHENCLLLRDAHRVELHVAGTASRHE
jgi:hypothetical protein